MNGARIKIHPFIRAALVLFALLLAVYIPLKIYIARSESSDGASREPVLFSIFVTNELNGYREPCG
ncbi:MAG TPA: hypothetical protein ENO08_04985 [Candidatus Eisenbacteria bacterium]|uniref:Uncharacterized protein n=1 Tax=Eiseniibacteriota bacterium TaxID=2212470 RepID=A0A7V2AV07_UNCEI|nr:hypothetical protein [Candidatus Eisenbacteria bacterium]